MLNVIKKVLISKTTHEHLIDAGGRTRTGTDRSA